MIIKAPSIRLLYEIWTYSPENFKIWNVGDNFQGEFEAVQAFGNKLGFVITFNKTVNGL